MRGYKPERAHFIPKGARKIAAKQSSAVLYPYEFEQKGKIKFGLMGFAGRRQKPDFHFYYANEAARLAKGESYFAQIEVREAVEIDRRAKPHELKVGDVLRSSWGYDQTNVDYYQVLRVIGKSMVEIQEIASDGYEDSEFAMQGQVVPMVGKFKGKPMRKRADGNSVRIASYASAYKIEPKMIAGVPVYESSRNSWYA